MEPAGEARRRGRPKGATNRRNADLHDYLVAHYRGLTPGQQLAAVGLATDREVSRAKKLARELGVEPVVAALIVKARAIAKALPCKPAEAWAIMAAARADLMPYVHQKRPTAVDVTSQGEKILPMIVGLQTVAPVVSMGGEVIEGETLELQRLNEMRPAQVGLAKSDDDPETLAPQGIEPA
jgi:hypothetical protein